MRTLSLEVEPSTTIYALKMMFLQQIEMGLDPEDCVVLLNNSVLDNQMLLSDYNIHDRQTLEIVFENYEYDPEWDICNGHT